MKQTIYILICVNVLFCANANQVLFQQQESVWVPKEFVQVVLNLDFSSIRSSCDELKVVINDIDAEDAGFNTQVIHSVFAQACASTEFWTTPSRRRRQLALAAGVVTGSIFGIFNAVAIRRLSSRLHQTDSQVHRGLVILQKHETRLDHIDHDFQNLRNTFAWYVKYLATDLKKLTVLTQLGLHLNALQAHTAAINRAWAALMEGRLSWDLLVPAQWVDVVRRVKDEAIRMGGRIPIDAPLDLLQFPATFQADRHLWTIFLHIPVIQEEYRLYRHLPLPLLLDDQANSSARVVTLSSPRPLLLVSHNDMLHQETSRDILAAKCHKIGTRLLCSDLGVFLRRMSASCLGSLFAQLPNDALLQCHMANFTQPWYILPIDSDTLIFFSKEGRGVDTICDNGTRTSQTVKGVANIKMDTGCSVSSSEFLVRRSAQTTVDIHVASRPDWSPHALEAAWTRLQQGAASHQSHLERELKALDKPAALDNADDKDWLERQLHPGTEQGRAIIVALLAVTACAMILFTGLVAFLLWRLKTTVPSANAPGG